MVLRRLRAPADASGVPAARLTAAFAAVRAELDVPGAFPDDVLADAQRLLADPPDADVDLSDVPFVTVDPPGATDLDQALHLRSDGDGLLLHYAIADVPAWVREGGVLAEETWRRAETLYAPDGKVPLHPPVISDGAASLLPDGRRTAIVWRIRLDERGEHVDVDVRRAWVASRARLDYAAVQAQADARPLAAAPAPDALDLTLGDVLPPSLPDADADGLVAEQAVLLRAAGLLRLAAERRRGGASLPLPSQEVATDGGRYRLVLRAGLPAEDWNAQLSLLTGMAAAQLMLGAGVGVLRTLPSPDPEPVERFRRQAEALGRTWSPELPYGAFLRGLDLAVDADLALPARGGRSSSAAPPTRPSTVRSPTSASTPRSRPPTPT
ncbi:MAG: RNB domain-containing ribonuclease [Kineosporiaceae bacterium]